MRRGLWRSLAAASVVLVGCGGGGSVLRLEAGRPVAGRFIGEAAYGDFLRAAMKEERGDLRGAVATYEAAATFDPDSASTWTHLGRLRCQIDPNDGAEEIEEALRLEPGYEPALEARSFCSDVRAHGLARATGDDSLRSLDPSPHALVFSPRAPADPKPELVAESRRLEERTLLHPDRVGAWEALAVWGSAHGDVDLAVRGMLGLARLDPASHHALGLSVGALAGAGFVGEARTLAGALLDARGDRTGSGLAAPAATLPLVAALGLDDAIASRDRARVEARCDRAHVGLEVAAGRAWASGDARLARDLARLVTRADPENVAARMVAEGAAGRARPELASKLTRPVPPEVALVYARDVLDASGPSGARRVLDAAGVTIPSGDARLTALAVELAVGGALAEGALPADARVELAVRRGTPADPQLLDDPSLDARHRLLLLAMLRPADDEARREARALQAAAPRDSLVAAALSKVSLARGEPIRADVLLELESASPGDAIAASALLDAARQSGTPAALSRARARLASVAKTQAEQARATE